MRPAVDVVVPFVGTEDELMSLRRQLEALDLGQSDSVTIVDNRPTGNDAEMMYGRVRVLGAPAVQSSYYARNCGARGGQSPWLLFVDADVRVSTDLLHRYFEPPPADAVGVLAGEIDNEPVSSSRGQTLLARYSALSGLFAQSRTFDRGEFGYAMTANCAIRRRAFEEVGGFVDNIRSGGDADICFRLRAKGWRIEARDGATVTHINRSTVQQLVRQAARHGSGAAWLEAIYPELSDARSEIAPSEGVGTSRPAGLRGRTVRSIGRLAHSAVELARGNSDHLLVTVIDIIRSISFQLGRHVSNEVADSGTRQ